MKLSWRIVRSKPFIVPFIVAAAVVLFYTLAGFFLVPYLVRHYTPKIVAENLAMRAAVGEVRFNPYTFRFEANDLSIAEPQGGAIAGLERVFLDFELKSLFRRVWTFREVHLEGLRVDAVIEEDGRLNLAGLLPPSDPASPGGAEREPPKLVVGELRIDGGRFDATDRRQSPPAAVTLHPLALHLRNLNTLPGQSGEHTFTAATPQGERLQWSGSFSLNPVAADCRLSIGGMKISTLTQFARDSLNLETPAGKLDLETVCEVNLGGQKADLSLSGLSLALEGIGLKLQDAESPFLELPHLLLAGGRLDLSGRSVEVGSIEVKGGAGRIGVAEDGTFNLQRVVEVSGKPAQPDPEPQVQGGEPSWKIAVKTFSLGGFALDYRDRSRTPAMDAAIAQLNLGFGAELETGAETKGVVSGLSLGLSGARAGLPGASEPLIRVEKAGLEGGAYRFEENRFSAAEALVEGVVADVRRQPDGGIHPATLFKPGKGSGEETGKRAGGKGLPFAFLVDRVSLSGLQSSFWDPAVREEGPILTLEDGSATLYNVDGRSPMKFDLGVRVREGGEIEAAGSADPAAPSVDAEVRVVGLDLSPFQPYIGQVAEVDLRSGALSTRGRLRHGIRSAGAKTEYEGGFDIEKLLITEMEGGDPLVGWDSVSSDQLKLRLGPDGVEAGEVLVSRLAGKIVIEKDMNLNLAKVIKPGDEAAAPTGEGFPYRVRRVLIRDGRVDFADLSLPVPFGTRVHDLKGSVAGISSAENARAQVALNGRVDDYGTAKVEGELNASNPRTFTDLSVIFRNVEMSRLTPYSGKFAGREIDSGKLSVDLNYRIVNSQLEGDNQIVVERLKLGERVESPDALNLPLDLAVALLEDSRGVIELGLPVRGSLDSPEFSFGGLIRKAIVNVLTRIVTSPFRALAALIPGGGEEELKSIEFEPGSAELSPPEREKLANLAVALQKRPQLTLTVQGTYNPEKDRPVLRTDRVIRDLAARLGRMVAPGEEPGPIAYDDPETVKALEAMFSERFGAEALSAVRSGLRGAAGDRAGKEPHQPGRAAGREDQNGDPGELARILFRELEESERVDEAALVRLAEERGRVVIEELGGPLSVPAERIAAAAPKTVEKSEPVLAELGLGVRGKE